ncbi:MAG: transcriptional repressor [Clostridium sp.]|nr:transcriptional repressor [Clostridium sp.]
MTQKRNTRQRQLVLDAVLAHKDHPSADQIYLEVRAIDQKISRGTVYRNLRLLAGKGEIHCVKVLAPERFDWRTEPHYHLRCTECGKVVDVPLAYKAELDREVSEKTGYAVAMHSAVFEGLCPRCRKI